MFPLARCRTCASGPRPSLIFRCRKSVAVRAPLASEWSKEWRLFPKLATVMFHDRREVAALANRPIFCWKTFPHNNTKRLFCWTMFKQSLIKRIFCLAVFQQSLITWIFCLATCQRNLNKVLFCLKTEMQNIQPRHKLRKSVFPLSHRREKLTTLVNR